MYELLRLIFFKKGFTCRVLPPGTVFATKLDRKTLTILIDLEQGDA